MEAQAIQMQIAICGCKTALTLLKWSIRERGAEKAMSTGKRHTDRVRHTVDQLLAEAQDGQGFLPGDVNALLRQQNEPMGAWEVRGELSTLERMGYLRLDAASGRWQRVEQRKIA